jgi:hypothetical protein
MSISFSNTTSKNGIIQLIERNCGFNDGDISGNTTRLAQFTGDVNLALDKAMALIFQVGGRWQYDDSNHTSGYPIITTNINSGQRNYAFTNDEGSNLILEIQKVMVADSTGLFREMVPVDVQEGAPTNYWDGLDTTGQPNTYDKLGNGIFLDPIPNYSRTNGLKIYINRESSYFTVSDTTKKPGFAGIFHEYVALRPSYQYAYRNSLPNVTSLERELLKMEEDLMDYYKSRDKDMPKVIKPYTNSSC